MGLTNLDVSGLTNLKWLGCGGNKLSKLDVSKNKALTELNCWSNNQLGSLDVSNNTQLDYLDCSGCGLTSLDLSKNTALSNLYCGENSIATLDLINVPKIAAIVSDTYKRNEDTWTDSGKTYSVVYYSEGVVHHKNKWGEEWDEYTGAVLGCDKSTQIITAPAPAPAPAAVSAPVPAVTIISAVKKSSKATVTAAPGTVCMLDLGGATGKAFKSSKKKVASVDGTGIVTINGAGKAKITFKVGKKKRAVKLTVKDPTIPTAVTLVTLTTDVKKGDTAIVLPVVDAGTNPGGYKWKSSNKKVATVNAEGLVTFKKAGKVTITCTAKRGKKKGKVKFKVSK